MNVWQYQNGKLSLETTAVMGILNLTPDSFSDGGQFDSVEKAAARARAIEADGAAILDIGGCSTRPGHAPLSDEAEWARIAPTLEALRGMLHIPLSVDTASAVVARRALACGAAIINDVSGSLQNGMLPLAAGTGAGIVLMMPRGGDGAAVRACFEQALAEAFRCGVSPAQIVLDAGIGFGTTRAEDLERVDAAAALCAGLDVAGFLCGVSRKRVTAAFCGDPPTDRRLAPTVALQTAAQLGGARIIRAHDVAEAVQAAKTIDALLANRAERKE